MKRLIILIALIFTTSAQAGDYRVDAITKIFDSKEGDMTAYKINISVAPGHGYKYLMCRSYPFVGGSADTIVKDFSGWKQLMIFVPYGSPRQSSVSCQFQRPVS